MAEVSLQCVSRVYPGGTVALDSVSIDVRDGELLVLLGPSGCGKTTTLRLIAGLEEPTSGQVWIAGRDVRNVSPRDRDVALVFQDSALYPHLTVRENLAFGLRMRYGGGRLVRWLRRVVRPRLESDLAAKRSGIQTEVRAAAGRLGIEPLLDRFPGQLSGGERQRVALGRAIVRRPVLFLFDEPLTNLDAKLRVDLRREIREFQQRLGTTMIYVTHDQAEALSLGDRIAVLDRGRLQQMGSSREVFERPANRFVAGFLGAGFPGSGPMNFLSGAFVESGAGGSGGVVFRGAGIELELMAEQQFRGRQLLGEQSVRRVTLGMRPADVLLGENDRRADAVRGIVQRVEFVGEASLAHVRLEAEDAAQRETELIVGKLPPGAQLQPGQQVGVRFDVARAHWFDADTGARLAVECEGGLRTI